MRGQPHGHLLLHTNRCVESTSADAISIVEYLDCFPLTFGRKGTRMNVLRSASPDKDIWRVEAVQCVTSANAPSQSALADDFVCRAGNEFVLFSRATRIASVPFSPSFFFVLLMLLLPLLLFRCMPGWLLPAQCGGRVKICSSFWLRRQRWLRHRQLARRRRRCRHPATRQRRRCPRRHDSVL